MAIDYSKWDKTYNISESDVEAMNSKNSESKEFERVPYGKYETKLTSLDLVETKKTDKNPEPRPMVSARFKILEGQYKNRVIFYNKVVEKAASIHFANEFLRSLESGVDVEWNGSFSSYADTIQQVFDEVEDDCEYGIDYSSNNGFDDVKITDVWDVSDK